MESLEITPYDAFPQTVNVLNKQGGIYLEGAAKRSGFGKLLFASTDMNKVINGASVILVILPSLYHNSIAQTIAPLLKDGQIVILNPITPLGTIDFQNTLAKNGCTADIVLAGTNTLLFAWPCRTARPCACKRSEKQTFLFPLIPVVKTILYLQQYSNIFLNIEWFPTF